MAKILAVDDQQDNLDLLVQALEDGGYEVATASDGKEAIIKASSESPDVILLDIQMPEMDGYEVCRRLKNDEETKNIPVIFLTANTGEQSVVKGLDLGAYDYVTKPFNEAELLARINVMVRIRSAEKKVEEIALTDNLTGLYNRRFLDKRFEEEISRAKRNVTPLSCFLLDIDFFKKINDTYGHDFGDFVLKEIADVLKNNLRGYDGIVRFGGEEFIVILPGVDADGAKKAAEKIRGKIESHDFTRNDTTHKVTISIGVFSCPSTDMNESIDHYIKSADEALYKAKESGRNRVVVYGE